MTEGVSPSPKFIDDCRFATIYRRQKSRTCSDCRKTNKRFRSNRWRSHRDPFHLVVVLSITSLMISCSTVKEVPVLVNAFIQNTYYVPNSAQGNTILQKRHRIRQLPILPHHRTSPLSAKKGSNEKDDSEKESPFGFFNRKEKREDPIDVSDEDGKPKDLPIVGRFFSTEEEKEERRLIKKAESEEKEKLKLEAKKEKERLKIEAKVERQRRERESDKDYNADDEENANVVTGVKNYFRERQIRKDSEILRFQVMRREEERLKQQEKDAEELRLAVQQREEDRLKKMAKNKMPTAPLVPKTGLSPTEDIVRRKIQSQKKIDLARKGRLEKIRAERGGVVPNPKEGSKQKQKDKKSDSSSKSQRLGGVVSAAQKFISGVFEAKAEEWIVVAPKTRISPGEIVAVTAAGIDLLLVASKDGSAVHCVANSCPHLGTPLEVGSLERLPIESKNTPPPSQQQQGSSPKVQPKEKKEASFFKENDIARMLKQDGCEDCIVCPLHKTAFALESGEVRGEWCPYPPVIGKLTGAVKKQTSLPVFDVRTKGKNIEIRLNTPVEIDDSPGKNEKKKR